MSITLFNCSASEVSSHVADARFSLIVASPPWNIGTPYSGSSDDREPDEYVEWLDGILRAAVPKLAALGTLVMDSPEFVRREDTLYYYPALFERIANQQGLFRRSSIAWLKSSKSGALHIGRRWRLNDFGSDATHLHSMTQWLLAFRRESIAEESIVVELPVERESAHPAAWPLSLAELVVRRYASRNGAVLDLFMGTGAVAVACQNAGHDFVGFETSRKYVSCAAARLRRHGVPVDIRT